MVDSGSSAFASSAADPSGTGTARATPLLNAIGDTTSTTILPASRSLSASSVGRWPAYGTTTNTMSDRAATSSLRAPPMDASGASSNSSEAASAARDSSLDPISTCSRDNASRSASPLPSGPVPPMNPITTIIAVLPPGSHGGYEPQRSAIRLSANHCDAH